MKAFAPVTCMLVGTLENCTVQHARLDGREFRTRRAAIGHGMDVLDHDDFRVATVVDGKLSAVGWGMNDFGPEGVDLPEVAGQLGLEVAS